MVGVISVAESIHHKKGTAARAVIPVLAKAGITRALIPQVETWGYRVLNIFAVVQRSSSNARRCRDRFREEHAS
jgi:hypothetical protein